MYLFLLLILNFVTFSKNEIIEDNYSPSIHKIDDYKNFDSIIDSNECCFFYIYDGKIINSKNENLNKIKNENIEKIEEISFTNPYVKEKRVRFYKIDFSKDGLEKFVKFYKPEGLSEIIMFYKGEIALRKKLEGEKIKSSNFLLELINDGFNNSEKGSKRRWSKKNKRIRIKHNLNLDNEKNNCCSYSSPSFGINFGIGMPAYGWPGAYYGYGPYWGGSYYRPAMGMSYGIGFGGHGGGCHGGHGRR